jgi:hypothetical protein
MPKTKANHNSIRTHLTDADLIEFKSLARVTGVSESQLAREAILAFLDANRQGRSARIESAHAQEVKTATNRICAMLAKLAMDTRAVYWYVSDGDRQTIDKLRQQAGQFISKALVPEEAEVAQRMLPRAGTANV